MNGTKANSFSDIVEEGVHHFRTLFKEDSRATIDVILRVASHFPLFIDQKDNRNLMVEISKEELLGILHSFQKDKSLGSNGLPTEFYLACFNTLGNDLLKVVEYSRSIGKILAAFNSTFITLIPKADNPSNFDQFRPILLCNNIYKTISKLIARILKDTLSNHICPKQFGLLKGRQIHEAIGLAQAGLHSIRMGNH